MRRLFFPLLLSALVVLVNGCSSKYRLNRDDLSVDSPWPFIRGETDALGAFESSRFPARFDIVWQQKVRDKPAGPLSIHHGALVYPGTKKKLKLYDIETGRSLGMVKAKGVPQTGLVMRDSICYFALAPKRNRLYGIDLVNKKTVFKSQVKNAVPGPIIVNGRLIMSSGEGTVVAYDLDDHTELWKFSADGRFSAPATFGLGKIFQPSDRGVLHVLSPDDGREILGIKAEGPLVSAVSVGKNVYATDMLGHVYAFDPKTGETVWQVKLAGPIWTSPAVMNDRLFVGHSGGELVALDAHTGQQVWRFETMEVVKASPLAIDEYVVVGTMGGEIFLLNAASGQLIARRHVKGAIAFPPVTDGERVFVATQSGRIICFGESHEQRRQTDRH